MMLFLALLNFFFAAANGAFMVLNGSIASAAVAGFCFAAGLTCLAQYLGGRR